MKGKKLKICLEVILYVASYNFTIPEEKVIYTSVLLERMFNQEKIMT